MQGAGSHLQKIIKDWLGTRVSGCGGCESLLRDMDRNPPQWTRDNLGKIIPTIRNNARKNKDWRARILANIPGVTAPIAALVLLAVRRAELEIEAEAEKAKNETSRP